MVAPFENLTVWQLAHDLALRVYKVTSTFPTQEQYGVVAQMRRAAVSIPANIAEGNARGSRADYLRFCHIARGSVAEMKYLLRLSQDLGLLSFEEYCKSPNPLIQFLFQMSQR